MFYTDRARDNRTFDQFQSQYLRSKDNEEKVIRALAVEYIARGYPAETVLYEPVDPSESFNDGKHHTKPDYFFWYDGKKYTIELKCFFGEIEDVVHIKCASILSMVKQRSTYPNGILLIATRERYAVMKAHLVAKYPIEVIEKWSNTIVSKKGFVIPTDDLIWKRWLSPIP